MRIEDYPPQEPLSDIARAYHDEVMARLAGVSGLEFHYGDDPYQGVLVVPAPAPSGDVLIFIHGGGWTNGYKEWMAFMAPALADKGCTFVSAGYRLAPTHLFPVGYEDAIEGLAWTYANIATHGGDPGRLFVGGHSAGGHYAALMAVSRDWQTPRELPANVIRGCLPVSGVYDFRAGNGMSVRPRFLGHEESGAELPASPIANIPVSGAVPPFLMAYGSDDLPHLVAQATAMEEALGAAGCEVDRIVLDGCNHFEANYAAGEAQGPWVDTAISWMRAH